MFIAAINRASGNQAVATTATYTFATAGYTPVGLNFVSKKSAQAGVSCLLMSLVLLLLCSVL